MSLNLDTPVRAGGITVAALCRTTRTTERQPRYVSFFAEKRPILVLIEVKGEVTARDLDGHAVPLAQVEWLCPGVLRRFRILCDVAQERD